MARSVDTTIDLGVTLEVDRDSQDCITVTTHLGQDWDEISIGSDDERDAARATLASQYGLDDGQIETLLATDESGEA